MSYWKYPGSINNHNYTWNLLNLFPTTAAMRAPTTDALHNLAKIQAARLMKDIGKSATVNMSYTCTSSTASSSNAVVFLGQNGFTIHSPPMVDYDYFDWVIPSMKSKIPLIVRGCTITDKCHAWVLDGFLHYKMTITIDNTPNVFTFHLIHNNWGWDGDSNGWFSVNVFNPKKRIGAGDTLSADTTRDFKYVTKISVGLHR